MRFRQRHPLAFHRDFLLLWSGDTISKFGSQISLLAVPLIAIDQLHASAFAVSLISALEMLPFVLVALPAGALVDRWRKRPVLLGTQALQLVTMASIPTAWAWHHLTLAQIDVAAFLMGTGSVFFDVAYQSYVPALVKPEELVEGNAKLGATATVAETSGPVLAGALVGAVGAAAAVVGDALSYAVSLVAMANIKAREESAPKSERRHLLHEIRDGLSFVWHERRIRTIAACTATSNFFSAGTFAIYLVWMRRSLHLAPTRIGLIMALGGLGALAAVPFTRKTLERLGVGRSILAGITLSQVGILLVPLAGTGVRQWLLSGAGFLWGFGGYLYNVPQLSLRQTLCPAHLRARMNASVRFVIFGVFPLGSALGGVLATHLGLHTTLWITALGGLGAIPFAAAPVVQAVRDMPTGPDVVAN